MEAHGTEQQPGITARAARKKLVADGDEAQYYLGSTESVSPAVMALYYQHGEMSSIEALAVDRSLRGRQIGSRVLAELIGISVADGSSHIRLVSLPDCVPFYERAGFKVVGDDREHIDMLKKL